MIARESLWFWVGAGILAVLLLLALLVSAAIAAALWFLANASKFDITGAFTPRIEVQVPIEHHPWDKPFQRTGDHDLPFAIHLKGTVYRWHSREYVFAEADFHKTFEDGPWKWNAQGRFAGAKINCGHYFGLSREAATDEARCYGISEDRAVLLKRLSRGLIERHPMKIPVSGPNVWTT
jgi:hypothetical protein